MSGTVIDEGFGMIKNGYAAKWNLKGSHNSPSKKMGVETFRVQ